MISKIEAVNYRCLRNVSQELDRFHVLAGPNGSGKSTFLEVVRILGAFAGDGLEAVWEESKAQQIPELLYCGQGHKFQLAIEMPIPERMAHGPRRKNGGRNRVIRYEVEIGSFDSHNINKPRIWAENFWLLETPVEVARGEIVQQEFLFPSPSQTERDLIHGQTKTPTGWRKVVSKSSIENSHFKSETSGWNFTLKNGPLRSAMSSLPEDERFGTANWAKTILTHAVKKLALRSELMQATCRPLKEETFSPDGSTLPLVIQRLRRDSNAYRAWLQHLQTVLSVENVEVIVREEDKNSYIIVSFDTGNTVPSWHLSDGALRLMALTLLPYLHQEGAIYLVEEPENGVHPQAVEAVLDSISSIYDGQCLVATHSPVLVGLIKPNQLLCFSKTRAGETDIIRGDVHPKLRQWQGEFRLAQLFAAGILS